MRATGRLCVPVCVLLAVLPATGVEAKITPLPKPAGIVAKPGAVRGTSLIAPVSRPAAHRTIAPARRHVASAHRATVRRAARAPRHAVVPGSSHGGRERAWRVLSSGGREAAAVAALVPTPLGVVGSGEVLPVYRSGWEAWKIAVLTLFAFGEGFVLVRLARDARSDARASDFI